MSDRDRNEPSENHDASADDGINDLDADEKAAFEKIMAEIESGETPDTPPTPDSRPEESSAPDESADGPGDPAPSSESVDDEASSQAGDNDELTDDEQAALDQIMSEINGETVDAGSEPAAETDGGSEDGDDQHDDALSEGQQAALDKIMSEIKGDNDDPDPEPQPETSDAEDGGDNDGDTLSEDQQAALDKIMSEIKGDAASSSAEDGADDPPDDPVAEPAEPDEEDSPQEILSIDEFNDELTSLLSAGAEEASSDEKPKKTTAPGVSEVANVSRPADDLSGNDDTGDPPPETGMPDGGDPPAKPTYTILQEVADAETTKRVVKKQSGRRVPSARLYKHLTAALLIVALAGGAYWWFDRWKHNRPIQLAAAIPPAGESSPPPQARMAFQSPRPACPNRRLTVSPHSRMPMRLSRCVRSSPLLQRFRCNCAPLRHSSGPGPIPSRN
jgi:hypothetical protein